MSQDKLSLEQHEFPVIVTDRLILRRFELEDSVAYAQELYADPEVTRYLRPMPGLSPHQWAQALVQRNMSYWDRYGLGPWAAIDKERGVLLGHGGFVYFNPYDSQDPGVWELELIYALARHVWGQGLATEIARACVRFGFEQLDVPHLCALTHPANSASQNVLRKVGMVRDEQAHPHIRAAYFRLTRDGYHRSDSLYRVLTSPEDPSLLY